MKIPTDRETSFMEPMTDIELLAYAEEIVQEMDEDKVITGAGMEFVTRADNIPCEFDQDTIMELVEDLFYAQESGDECDTGDTVPCPIGEAESSKPLEDAPQ